MKMSLGEVAAVSVECDNVLPPRLAAQVFELLQTQWPIHAATRHRGLEPKPNQTRLLLVVIQPTTTNQEVVVGHALLKWSSPTVCLVVSVVVHKEWRRCGLGRRLMLEVEAHVRRVGGQVPITTYLWTTDQGSFFQSLGYTPCPPYVHDRATVLAHVLRTKASPPDVPHKEMWLHQVLLPIQQS
ncbi:hypothetical protein H310_14118 [Aphanomyces invadans]|uniref:N-acetyltransferase domain-containing protein n=1 Tax=Aphanomyces invadans TaxID=157072 RepID=A0A024TB63_9STRA|nr:hypothetical protein H310_14118 [Aphanomyces invadans]ETV91283.1 hypothetical protein H310_14118 [Aphanomyces invadans]|eukprot:XP_008880120.1 hypothetical protein H310_14118 [Aphanomyces invadans]